jgi:hypothetical protein
MIERDLVTEEEGLVGGHRFHDFRHQRLRAALHLLHELGYAGKVRLARQRHQPAFHQVLLIGGQVETGTLLQKPTQILIV